jgi:hypothetical protein
MPECVNSVSTRNEEIGCDAAHADRMPKDVRLRNLRVLSPARMVSVVDLSVAETPSMRPFRMRKVVE